MLWGLGPIDWEHMDVMIAVAWSDAIAALLATATVVLFRGRADHGYGRA